jgi:hypothetical protein
MHDAPAGPECKTLLTLSRPCRPHRLCLLHTAPCGGTRQLLIFAWRAMLLYPSGCFPRALGLLFELVGCSAESSILTMPS